MSFSWDQIRKDAETLKIRRAKNMAKSALNDDFKNSHPDWVQGATSNNYVQLISDIKKKVKKRQDLAMARRAKRAGKL